MTTITQPATRFEEILFATDFSNESQKALLAAKALARHSGARIAAVNVTELPSPMEIPEGTWSTPPDLRPAREQMEQLTNELRADGLNARGTCLEGGVEEEILHAAQETGADLIVTGSHGRLSPSRWIYGSTAENLARNASLPLLVVGPRVSQHALATWSPARILCAATMDEGGEEVVRYTEALARELNARWELACDYDDDLRKYSAWEKFRDSLARDLTSEGAGIEPDHAVLLKRPYPQHLADLASARKADLLVIGHSHRLLTWSHFRSGTIPRLLAAADCPILTLPNGNQS
jgi:nucleotide-binding universal stress UspA family protein